LDAIVAIQTSYFGAPNGALVSPRRLAFLQKAKDGGGQYLLAAPGTRGPNGGSGLLATQAPIEILGIPIGVSTNIPTNLGVGTNQDAIIVGDWNEAHWFQRQDMTLDSSDVAGTAFEQNQVWFRLEERVGFTAERFPQAFAVISGAGLVP
jgi:HK97 family phage major capsid protein